MRIYRSISLRQEHKCVLIMLLSTITLLSPTSLGYLLEGLVPTLLQFPLKSTMVSSYFLSTVQWFPRVSSQQYMLRHCNGNRAYPRP